RGRPIVQQDFERRGDRGRGEPDRGSFGRERESSGQRGDDRDFERFSDDYGQGMDARQRRSPGYAGSGRARISDRERYAEQQRQDRYKDEMRGFQDDR